MTFPEAPWLPHYLGLEPALSMDYHCTVQAVSHKVTEDNKHPNKHPGYAKTTVKWVEL